MKKIFFICNRYTANQDIIEKKFGRQIVLARLLKDKGYRVTLYCADYKKHQNFSEEYNGIKIYSASLTWLNFFSYILALIKTIKKEDPDIIIGGSVPLWGTVGNFISIMLKKKFIYDIQDNYLTSRRFISFLFSLFLHKLNVKLVRNISVVSETLLDNQCLTKNNTAVIPNGIDLDKFKRISKISAREKWGFKKGLKYIGYCGTIAKNRGIAQLQDAFIRLDSERNDVKLVLAGGITDQSIYSSDNIEYLGNIDPSEVPSLLNALDLIVIPNPENEFTKYCFPYKVLEAMACNENVLMSRTGVLGKFNLDSQYYIKNPDNIEGFKNALNKQLNIQHSKDLRFIVNQYSTDAVADDLDRYIRKINQKKIAIICDNIDDIKRTGTANYAYNLINNLNDSEDVEYLIVHKKYQENLFTHKRKEIIIKDHPNFFYTTFRKVFIMPFILLKYKVDLVHETYQMGPFIITGFSYKKVVTIHDIFFKTSPKSHNKLSTFRHTLSIPIILRNVDQVITDSFSSKKDILNHYSIREQKIKVIHLGASAKYAVVKDKKKLTKIKEKYKLPDKFMVSVSTVEPRKNILSVLESIKRMKDKGIDITYLIIGKENKKYRQQLEEYITEQNISQNVRFLEYITEEDLVYIYNLAYLFVLPSFYEGFGLPIIEAMACGCPVITSNISSLPEIVGDAGLTIDPKDISMLTKSIERIWNNKPLRDNLAVKSKNQAEKFTWEKCADETRKIYEELL